MEIFSEDSESILRGNTFHYKYVVVLDYLSAEFPIELTTFDVSYTFTEQKATLLNNGPYFDPPLTKIIQIYRQAE